MQRVFAALLGALLLGPLTADAGYLIVDQNGEQVLLSAGRLKMAPKSAGGLVMVLDVGRGRLWVADPSQRRYWEGTVDEYCDGVRGLTALPPAEIERLMADQLKDMPPDERERTLQLMKRAQADAGGAGRVPKVSVQRTADTETIAGLPTRKYQVLADGALYEELWLATAPGLLRELIVARAPETFGRMSGCLASGGGSRVETTDEYRRIYSEGWPLKAVFYGTGGPTPGTPVTRVERREIAEGEFTRPAGFTAMSLLEVFGRAAR